MLGPGSGGGVDIRELYAGLNRNGYICDPPFAAKVTAALGTRPQAEAFLFGPSGTGKTMLPDTVAGLTGHLTILRTEPIRTLTGS